MGRKLRVAINGFGRIGRLFLRQALHHQEFEIVAVNDVIADDNLLYLFKYDSTHGQFDQTIALENEHLVVAGQKIKLVHEKKPEDLPWKSLEIDYVVESTGLFTHPDKASAHIKAGAKRVILSAPGKGDLPTFVMGVNHEKYNPNSDFLLSNASCTTNCLALITKVLLDHFGIEEGLMSTIHALTLGQSIVDGPSKKDLRAGRGALQNIIPASTGAAKAVGKCLPEVQGKLTGMSFRVPVADVSCVDLTVRLAKSTSYEELCQAMKDASKGAMKDLLHYTEEAVVSSDFIGSSYSSIFDATAGIALNDRFFKLIAWYDNEMGYAARVVDLLAYMATKEGETT